MNADKDKLDSLTERVLDAVFEVTNTLGAGFLEKVYQRALLRELGLRGIRATAEASFTVTYKSHSVGEYFADLLVEDVLVVELKCVERLSSEHTAHCLNYLRASGRTVCLLVNFQKPKVEWKRIVQGQPGGRTLLNYGSRCMRRTRAWKRGLERMLSYAGSA